HAFDGARGDAGVDHVADAVLVFHQHEHAGEEVLYQRLRAEAERHTGDPRAGDERAEVDAEDLEHGEHRDRPDGDGDDAAHHRACWPFGPHAWTRPGSVAVAARTKDGIIAGTMRY